MQSVDRRTTLTTFLGLFASSGTLVCCAIPALLVALGAGAALSGLVSVFPQVVWLSDNKAMVFGLAAVLLLGAGVLQWRNRFAPCPIDPQQKDACMKARRLSARVYWVSVAFFLTGGFFAFVLPALAV